MLVDSHCHLDFPDFAPDLEDVVMRARAGEVRTMLTIGTKLREFAQVRAVAERFDGVWCSVGVHPHEVAAEPVEDMETLTATLVEHTRHAKVVGIGETGLDYFYEHSPRDAQKLSFRAHVRAAQKTGLPLIVHARDADRDIAALLREEYARKPFRGLIHCFTADRELLEAALELGLFFSFSGILTFKKTEALRAIAAEVPLERVLVETDAPYLAPVPHRGKRNEPAFVRHTAEILAQVRGVSLGEIERRTTENFFRLFDKTAPPGAENAGG